MSIKVNLYKTHMQHTDGKEAVEVDGSTVGECLKKLVSDYPGLEKEIFDQKGKIVSVLEVYLNDSSAYPNELEKPVKDGDEIHLLPMLAGG